MKKKGVYAGSFDPLTNGHMWMIREGSLLFDEFIVVIGTNPEKTYTFTPEERFNLLQKSIKGIKNVQIDFMENRFLVKYAESVEANYILRGIRSENDYFFERVMRNINGDMNNQINTIFLMPPREIAEVSSSMIKGLIGPDGWQEVIKKYVPEPVYKLFIKRFGKS
ncbi:MAG TPA: pantetheine-phosphate adenylyltransferase [Candidatus Eremiobacteraeota bacterium]|nr:MAG: Phosphopantetheine adenylyltransferase [bacterium ADurb.Bin363]HPZ06577.1 pantetheine-phosphate adenylyltransferase [Candidatus Eremiobacteraeota bacterium]